MPTRTGNRRSLIDGQPGIACAAGLVPEGKRADAAQRLDMRRPKETAESCSVPDHDVAR